MLLVFCFCVRLFLVYGFLKFVYCAASCVDLSLSHCLSVCLSFDCFVGIVVKVSATRAKDPGLDSCLCHGNFSESSHTSDLNKISTPVATLPGIWCYRVCAWTGWPGVGILWLGEVESLICNFHLNVAAHKIEQILPRDTLACCWNFKQPTDNKLNNIFQNNIRKESSRD